ncbi:hypothetical protein BN1195_03635 [Chryseobacterium oranimense G311]|uniref:hypothetical protein n=1 Tax=Chryseobacterium oranimense TaxID=421058 RepID=UPI000533BBF3|nr:hypothetical protein [Chryseobacterium oranimense]CEJ71290.1 hypothetical protein BN1195_03635 [Chryseobacterium oranimense G311]DAG72846.1 MAG TPA: Styelin [Caudoviricetes sp.]
MNRKLTMKTVKYTLESGQEIELSPEDIKGLKQILDREFENLDETVYKKLKVSTPDEIAEALGDMTDEELLQFAKVNDQYRREGYIIDPFSQKIYRELFIRARLGFKQLRKLSVIQRNFLESKGLRIK